EDAVVGGGGVRDVADRLARHVAVDAAVLRAGLQPLIPRQAAPALLVAGQAALPVVPPALGRLDDVDGRGGARDAAQLVVGRALAEAAAGAHLLDVVDRLAVARPALGDADEHGHDLLQRQPRPEVVHLPAAADDSRLAGQVALLAHGLAQ